MKISILLMLIFSTLQAKTLICSYGDYNGEPYMILKDGKPHGGIIKDICERIGRELEVAVELRNVSRKRAVKFCVEGYTHFIVTAHPAWLPGLVRNGYWMPKVFEDTTILAYNNEASEDIKTLSSLKGKVVGGVFGYHYNNVELNTAINNGDINRDDAPSLIANLEKLLRKRVDAVLVDEIGFSYLIMTYPRYKHLRRATFKVATGELTPVLSKKAPFDPVKFKKIFTKLIDDGSISRILGRYR